MKEKEGFNDSHSSTLKASKHYRSSPYKDNRSLQYNQGNRSNHSPLNNQTNRSYLNNNPFNNLELKNQHYQTLYLYDLTKDTTENDINHSLEKFFPLKIFWFDKFSCSVLLSSEANVIDASKEQFKFKVKPLIDQNTKRIIKDIKSHHFNKVKAIGEYNQDEEHMDDVIDFTAIPIADKELWEKRIEDYNQSLIQKNVGFGYNPEIKVTEIKSIKKGEEVKKEIIVHVIRDDFLEGGTKQRALLPMLFSSQEKEFIYAGPVCGFAQVALSYSIQQLKFQGKIATLFFAKTTELHSLTKRAKDFGANLNPVSPGYLKNVQLEAEKYSKDPIRAQNTKLLPFGLYYPEFIWTLKTQIQNTLPKSLIDDPPKRLWLIIGSGTVFSALKEVWPKTHYLIVQVGKYVNEKMLKNVNYTVYIAPESFESSSKTPPPYPSASSYDAKIWQFISEHGQDGDYIWNVAG